MYMINLDSESHYTKLGLLPDASIKEIRASKTKIVGDLKHERAQARCAEERKRLDALITDLNTISDTLTNPTRKADYDAANAQLTFFIVLRATAPILEERDLRMRWVHNALRNFLLTKGETVSPLDDLERIDFSGDYSRNSLLEQIMDSGR